ncbi:MAG: acyltransferase [Gloeobacteraceae cyanobacterium ES-bin-144]|nr:acyltransferase [Verrucomicrobiales bacterium]
MVKTGLPATPSAGKHFTGLDGLRGAAALMVFLSHASADHQNLLGLNFKGLGKCGVALFFILSAHLLTSQFLQKNDVANWSVSRLWHYFLRRFMRIYPLYFVFLTLALATTWASAAMFGMKIPDGIPLTLDLRGWVEQLILVRGDGVTWSIAVEFKYYFFLPVVAYLLFRLLEKGLVAPLLLMIAGIGISVVAWPPGDLDGNDPRMRAYLGIFLTGSLCGLIGSQWDRFPAWKFRLLSVLVPLGFGFLILTTPPLITFLGIADPKTYRPEQWMFAHGLAFIPILFSASFGQGPLHRIFSTRVLRFVGMISFSFYLWHPVFTKGGFRLLKYVDMPIVVGWLALAGTILASYISYRLIEKPFLKVGGQPKLARAEPPPPHSPA